MSDLFVVVLFFITCIAVCTIAMMIAIVHDVKKLLRELVSAIRDRDSVIVQSADSDIGIIRERQSRLEGVILALADRTNDSGETNLLLREFIRAMDSNRIVLSDSVHLSTGQADKPKPKPKETQLIEWLNSNNWRGMTVRQIAVEAKVSKSLVAETIKQLK